MNILVIKLGALGDFVQAMGPAAATRAHHRDAEITLLTTAPYAELGLDNPDLSDGQLIDTMLAHPILIERPIVVGPAGVRLCRPPESVLEILS